MIRFYSLDLTLKRVHNSEKGFLLLNTREEFFMKRIIISLISVAAVLVLFSCAGMNPKVAACKQACKSALEKCKEDARGNAARIAACTVSYDKCCSECR